MTFPKASEIINANLQRTKYLLKNFERFQAQCPEGLALQTSKAVLDILSFSIGDRDRFSQADIDLMDRCGNMLAPAIRAAAEAMREFPVEVAEKVYPVLYHMYLSPDGSAIDTKQLMARLFAEDTQYTEQEVLEYLDTAERMMSALLFCNKYTLAVGLCD